MPMRTARGNQMPDGAVSGVIRPGRTGRGDAPTGVTSKTRPDS